MTTSTPLVKADRRSAIAAVFHSTKLWKSALCLGLALGPAAGSAYAYNGHKLDFGIVEGQVVPAENFAIKVTMLGSAITSNGKDMPVTMQVRVHDDSSEPFGTAASPLVGNVNDHMGPRSEIVHQGWEKNLPVTVTATSWALHSDADGNSDGDYYPHHNRNSNGNHPYVRVLRHGDPVPAIAGFQDQTSIAEFVKDYVDLSTNTMVLDENAAIFLFELGVEDLDSEAADFQDLVVLINLGRSVAELQELDDIAPLFD